MGQAERYFDAIVVGSGIAGGWAAKELTERGLKTLVLERGPAVEHVSGYPFATTPPWKVPHRGQLSLAQKAIRPIAAQGPAREENADWWANEQQAPYIAERPFNWYRGYQVGGRSLLWGRQTYRWSDIDFEANSRDGLGLDWPIRYRDLETWYDYVESFIGVSGSLEGLPHLPDGKFLPPFSLNALERELTTRLPELFGGSRRLIPGRVANLSVAHGGRGQCRSRGKCDLGCPYGAYFSSQSSTLPAAEATGLMTLRPGSLVKSMVYDSDRKRVSAVEVIDVDSKTEYTFYAKVVFLCASTLNSTWLLLNSAREVWPGGLGSSSGVLGRYLMDHQTLPSIGGTYDGLKDRTTRGNRPGPCYVPRYRNLGSEQRPYKRAFAFQVHAFRPGWDRSPPPGFGGELLRSLKAPGPWEVRLMPFGEILPYRDNTVALDSESRDAWGLPVLRVSASTRENEALMADEMRADAKEMLRALGFTNVRAPEYPYVFGSTIHEMGTARMGRDPKTSVLNAHNQVWDAPNVFVTDGACMTSSGVVNPSLTYMALTARAAAYAVAALKRGDL